MSRQLSELKRHRGALIGVVVFTVVALLLTSMVAGTLSRAQRGDSITVTAVFRDATGLRAGDDVRVAGVRVGRVAETRVGTGEERGLAVVTLTVDADQGLHEDVVAGIDYLNLMGQRYVALSRPDVGADAEPLADGARIPLERTRPALDLTAMFNAFQPIFELLQPGDINQLATNVVQVLQGQGPTLKHLLDQTAELTHGLVDREETLARVVDNVNLVLETTNAHRGEITAEGLILIGEVAMMALMPWSGGLSDRFGRKPSWYFSLAGIILLAIPMFMLMGMDVGLALVGFAVLGLLYIPQLSTITATFPAMFPTQARFSGFAITYNIATSIFGGTAALVNEWAIGVTGDVMFPAYYMMAACAVGLVSVWFMRETAGASLRGSEIPGAVGSAVVPGSPAETALEQGRQPEQRSMAEHEMLAAAVEAREAAASGRGGVAIHHDDHHEHDDDVPVGAPVH